MTLHSNLVEAANRAEATALLIRYGYRVYRPEADVLGEDLILRTPDNGLIVAQLKSRPFVNIKYFGQGIWMLFPNPGGNIPRRDWFLVEHDALFKWWEKKHSATTAWKAGGWSTPGISNDLKEFLLPFALCPKRSE